MNKACVETASIAEIRIYPIKSLPGLKLEQAAVRDNGALADDRRWAIFDSDGRVVNGKRTPRIHALDAHFAAGPEQVVLVDRAGSREAAFQLTRQAAEAAAWLSEFFGFPVELREDVERGFPDDRDAPAPTVVSTATLEAVAGWFPPLELEQIRRRFRANIELSCPAAFWEDCLFGEPGQVVRFDAGEVELAGVNPCQRCVVPTRHSESGEIYPHFAATFSQRRQATLPDWATASRFNHFYRLAVNTRGVGPQRGRHLRVGDRVCVRGIEPSDACQAATSRA
ncbi:MAG TPA: MOSC N-terminal beta barrel domain-containing protein [Pirellulales bacterium]